MPSPLARCASSIAKSLSDQRRTGIWVWVLPFVLPVLLLAGAALLNTTVGVPVSDLTRDPVAERKDIGVHIGALSNVGVMVWTASAAVCLFTGCLLYRRQRRRRAAFLAVPGVVSATVAKDDLFMLHEHVLPTYFSISETAVYMVYLVTMGLWLVVFRHEVIRSPWPLLMAAAVLLASSMLFDKLPKLPVAHTAMEDALKFLGIFAWAGYFVNTCAAELNGRSSRPRRAPARFAPS